MVIASTPTPVFASTMRATNTRMDSSIDQIRARYGEMQVTSDTTICLTYDDTMYDMC